MPKGYRPPCGASTRPSRCASAWIGALALLLAPGSRALVAQAPGIDASVGGLILMNGFYISDKVNNSDVPQFAVPPDPPGGPPAGATGATMRQSRVTVRGSVLEIAGGALAGEVDVDFYGGQQPSTGGRTFPLIRLRRAFAELRWRHAAIFAGQESPPIVEVNPSSLASIGFPEFAGAGNLWLWIPQIRVQGFTGIGSSARLAVEVAALAPTSGDAQTAFLTQPDIAERSSRPYLQGRVHAQWGQPGQEGEVSLGGHYGWLAVGPDRRAHSKAVALSLWTPIVPRLEVRAEAFAGEALAGLGGGGIGQSFGRDSVPVATTGGWAQLNLRPTPMWEIGVGAGIDDPDDDDLDPAIGRLRNLAFEGHIVWRLSPVVVGGEVRRLETRYAEPLGDLSATQINVAVGFEF
jgi:hypothetical protein